MKCQVTDEAPNLKTEDVILCCVARASAQPRGTMIDEYGTVVG
jgi:hypothetical protein